MAARGRGCGHGAGRSKRHPAVCHRAGGYASARCPVGAWVANFLLCFRWCTVSHRTLSFFRGKFFLVTCDRDGNTIRTHAVDGASPAWDYRYVFAVPMFTTMAHLLILCRRCIHLQSRPTWVGSGCMVFVSLSCSLPVAMLTVLGRSRFQSVEAPRRERRRQGTRLLRGAGLRGSRGAAGRAAGAVRLVPHPGPPRHAPGPAEGQPVVVFAVRVTMVHRSTLCRSQSTAARHHMLPRTPPQPPSLPPPPSAGLAARARRCPT